MKLTSQVLITTNIDNTILTLESLVKDERLVKVIKEDNFLVDDAKIAMEKAYLASDEVTVIVLAAKNFSPIVQNKLLKIIEEPPPKKEFILVTHSKSTILDTIKSRLPVYVLDKKQEYEELGIDLDSLVLQNVYDFVKTHQRTDSKEMKVIIQQIIKEAIFSNKYDLNSDSLKLFSQSYVALDVGSPSSFVLNTILLKLLARKK